MAQPRATDAVATTRSRHGASALALPSADYYVAFQDDSPSPHETKHKKLLPHADSAHATQRYSLSHASSLAIPVTYLCVGLLLAFPRAYIEYFPRSKQASDAQLSTVSVVRSLPWCVKVLFGVLPDNFPIRQRRFKPYMVLGYAVASFFNALLAWHGESLSVVAFTLLLLGAMSGTVLADVMGDALVASRVIRQQESAPGHTQSTVYLCRYLSEMVGFWGGALLSNKHHWGYGLSMGQVFGLLALLPIISVLPCIYTLEEPTVAGVAAPWARQRELLWAMLQRRATWQPLCFLALFNGLLVPNAAWGNYLNVAFHFDAFQYGALSAIGASVTFVAVFVYRQYIMNHFEAPWHHVYYVTGGVVALFSLVNVLLVFGVNEKLGIPPFWFAMGDSAVISFARGFQQLPLARMLVSVCPENQEGVAYALLTSIVNLSHAFAATVSNLLLRIWPVELPDLERGDYSGVWKLTVLTSTVSLVPLLFVRTLLPRGRRDQETMREDLSLRGARIALALYAFGFVWVGVLSLLAVVMPCSVLVGGHGC